MLFAFGNCYSSRNQKTSQILNAQGHYIIPFDNLTSNFIHFLIAYKSLIKAQVFKSSPYACTSRKCLSKVSFSQSASLVLVTQFLLDKVDHFSEQREKCVKSEAENKNSG